MLTGSPFLERQVSNQGEGVYTLHFCCEGHPGGGGGVVNQHPVCIWMQATEADSYDS